LALDGEGIAGLDTGEASHELPGTALADSEESLHHTTIQVRDLERT
jgi:hypothetical protein